MHGITDEQNYIDIANAIREKNGSDNTYAPSEMASAIEEFKVGELDFEEVFDQEQAEELNQYYKGGIEYAKEIKENWSSIDRNKLIYLPEIDLSNVTSINSLCYACRLLQMIHPINSSSVVTANNAFYLCSSLLSLNITLNNATTLSQFANQCSSLKKAIVHAPNNTNLFQAFQSCYNLSEIELNDMPNVTNYQQAFENTAIKSINLLTDNAVTLYRTFYTCGQIESIILTSIKNLTNSNALNNTFAGCTNLITLEFSEWLKYDISLSNSNLLSAERIRYIIWHSKNGTNNLGYEAEGATSRTLQLHATPYASWEEWKLTKPSVEDCEFLGIDETEITKYGELTWEDIALNVKLITIAK